MPMINCLKCIKYASTLSPFQRNFPGLRECSCRDPVGSVDVFLFGVDVCFSSPNIRYMVDVPYVFTLLNQMSICGKCMLE